MKLFVVRSSDTPSPGAKSAPPVRVATTVIVSPETTESPHVAFEIESVSKFQLAGSSQSRGIETTEALATGGVEITRNPMCEIPCQV